MDALCRTAKPYGGLRILQVDTLLLTSHLLNLRL
jgi:hypothetical protein